MNENPIAATVLSAAQLILAMSLIVSCDDPATNQPLAPESRQESTNTGKGAMSDPNVAVDRQQPPEPARNAAEETRPPAGESSKDSAFICGGETTRASVDRYFADLRSALAAPGPGQRLHAFLADRFAITDAEGKQVWFTSENHASGAPDKVTREEWTAISARGASSLSDAGWRGCFMDDGKVWFEADADSGLKLIAISRTMPWIEPIASR